jgi:hypothetical protein
VGEIPNRRLENAERHLTAIAKGSAGFRIGDIDWNLVRQQLLRLQSAVHERDIKSFDEAYSMLKRRLIPAIVVRGEIGPEPENNSTFMPPEVFELLNHVVDTLHLKLSQPSPQQQKDKTEK